MLTLFAGQPTAIAAESAGDGDSELELPSLELLEFLGSFETDSGVWVDPVDLMQPEFEALLKSVQNVESPDADADSNNPVPDPSADNDGV